MITVSLLLFCCLYSFVTSSYLPSGQFTQKWRFAGDPSDFHQDRGKARIGADFVAHTDDETDGFPGAYSNDAPGGPNVLIDQDGYLVIQPTCPVQLSNGDCKAVQCNEQMINGQTCQCNNETIINKWFPWWCQLGWGGAKIISEEVFNLKSSGGVFVFENVWIPRGKPLWPAIWLLPANNPVYGGQGSPKGGDWATWPNNGEIDILESIGIDPRIYGTIHYSCGNEYNGWAGFPVTANASAVKGTAYEGDALKGNILATRSEGNNPVPEDGHLGTLCFMWFVDDQKGPMMFWFVADEFPIDNGYFNASQLDVMVNRMGTDQIFGVTGDGTGALSFETTPFWPGSLGNSPPLTLYKGWDGKESYGFQGYYPVSGNVKTASVGIHNGVVSPSNPNGLGIVPQFLSNGSIIPNTIAQLYEPLLCSMIGDWGNPHPFPWVTEPCTNPPPGSTQKACPQTGTGPENTYNYCWVEGASKPSVGWWSNSPMAKGAPFAPFDPNQNWNLILNVAIGGQWPRSAGQEGAWGENFIDMDTTNLKMKSISYYEIN